MGQTAGVRELKLQSTGFWRSLFKLDEAAAPLADPLHCDAPMLRHAEIAAVYSGQRVAGDFYEFLRVGPSRMLFVLLDIAGLRADTREILIAVQKTFRTLAPELLSGEDFNETTAMIELCNEMNLTILRGGLRSCPAFIGCYNEDLGTVCYANAGHTPGLLRDNTGITVLEATGHDRLLAGHPILRLAVDLRNPYVDALSFLQLRFLRELETAGADRAEKLSTLVRLTINGVAAGLQNTG